MHSQGWRTACEDGTRVRPYATASISRHKSRPTGSHCCVPGTVASHPALAIGRYIVLMTITLTRDQERFELGERVPVLPLRDVVVFPYMVIPLLVGRAASLAAIEAALDDDRWIFLVAQRNGELQEPAAADLFRIGVAGRVLQIARTPNGTTKVLVEGVARARVTRY